MRLGLEESWWKGTPRRFYIRVVHRADDGWRLGSAYQIPRWAYRLLERFT